MINLYFNYLTSSSKKKQFLEKLKDFKDDKQMEIIYNDIVNREEEEFRELNKKIEE